MSAGRPEAASPDRAAAPYTLKHIEDMLGMGRAVVARLVRSGFVTPARGARNELRFSFQDVVLLRTAFHLRSQKVPPRRLLESLRSLRQRLPEELPLSGLRIKAIGADVAVKEGDAHWDAASGQLLMDFEVVAAAPGGAVALLVREPAASPEASAEERLAQAMALENVDVAQAEAAYRDVIERDPSIAHAWINLSALLIDEERTPDALDVLRRAVEAHPHDAMLQFNLAVVLEDAGLVHQALAAYERCLAIDAEFIDAHFNAARLYEIAGDRQATLRHYSAYWRLS